MNNMIKEKTTSTKNWLIVALFIILSSFFLVGLIFWTIVPYFQMKAYIKNMRSGDINEVLKTDSIFSPYTNVQNFMRKDLLDKLIRISLTNSSQSLFDEAISKMEESMNYQNSNINNYILLALAYIKKAQISNDSSFFLRAEGYYKKAIEFSPKQQTLLVAYSGFLIDQNRNDEAIELLQHTVDLSSKDPLPNFYLGMAKIAEGENYYTEALDHLESFFESDFGRDTILRGDFLNPDPGWSKTTEVYRLFLRYFYQKKDIERILTVTKRLSILDKTYGKVFGEIAKYIAETGQMPVIKF